MSMPPPTLTASHSDFNVRAAFARLLGRPLRTPNKTNDAHSTVQRVLDRLIGHAWTLGPTLRHSLRPQVQAPQSEAWTTDIRDELRGSVRLSGYLHPREGATSVVVIVHGMGGSPDSFYCHRAAVEARKAGLASLRLALRGADREGQDYGHAGLTADIQGALTSPALAGFEHLYVLGYSLGGHASLCLASEQTDQRLRAVAAICPPLGLAAGQRHIDRPRSGLYRRALLRGLKEVYAAVAKNGREVPLPLHQALRIRTIRDWDELVVAPRWGFEGADHYYDSATVVPRLQHLEVPTLVVSSHHDPIVAHHTVAEPLRQESDNLEVRWVSRAGHVGFPDEVDLGLDQPAALVESQVMGWLLNH